MNGHSVLIRYMCFTFSLTYESKKDVVKNAISKPYKHNNGIKSGDTIGVWVNMDARTLAFYQNGEYCGVAFTNLPEMVSSYCVS